MVPTEGFAPPTSGFWDRRLSMQSGSDGTDTSLRDLLVGLRGLFSGNWRSSGDMLPILALARDRSLSRRRRFAGPVESSFF